MGKDKKESSKVKKQKRPREEQAATPTVQQPEQPQQQQQQSQEQPSKKVKTRHTKYIVPYASPIALPKATDELSKQIFDTIRKANAAKGCLKGIKLIEKSFRKGEKGFVILAGDVYPIDIIAHLPVLCEDYNVPYIFVNSKYAISAALSIKRPVSALFISSKCSEQIKDQYEPCLKAIKSVQVHA